MNTIILADGFLDGVDTLQDTFTLIILIVILLAAVLVRIGFYRRETWYRIILGIFCVGFFVVCYFCFRHEMRHYFLGSILAAISLVGFYKTFSK